MSPQVIQMVKKLLRHKTGTVVVRDYAEGDLAEQRLANHGSKRELAEHFYIRGDGTKSFYFTKAWASLTKFSCIFAPLLQIELRASCSLVQIKFIPCRATHITICHFIITESQSDD